MCRTPGSPRYITATLSVTLGLTMSPGHQHATDPGALYWVADELEDLILDGDVQRRGRLIGDDEARDPRRAMAITTRWRVPQAGEITAGTHPGSGIPTAPISSRAIGKGRLAEQVGVGGMVSTSCCSTVNSGLREVMGSWKMKPMREPARWPASRSALPEMSSPLRWRCHHGRCDQAEAPADR